MLAGAVVSYPTIVWTSSDSRVAGVSASGLVAASGKAGHTVITAASGASRDTTSVTVYVATHPTGIVTASVLGHHASSVAITPAGTIVAPSWDGTATTTAPLATQGPTRTIASAGGEAVVLNAAGTTAYLAD
jgi:hypothetical protein